MVMSSFGFARASCDTRHIQSGLRFEALDGLKACPDLLLKIGCEEIPGAA